jgi:hypothetical protein
VSVSHEQPDRYITRTASNSAIRHERWSGVSCSLGVKRPFIDFILFEAITFQIRDLST